MSTILHPIPRKRQTQIVTAVSSTFVIPAPCDCDYAAEISGYFNLTPHDILEMLMEAEDRALTLLTQQDRLGEISLFPQKWAKLNQLQKLTFVMLIVDDGMTVTDAAHEVEGA